MLQTNSSLQSLFQIYFRHECLEHISISYLKHCHASEEAKMSLFQVNVPICQTRIRSLLIREIWEYKLEPGVLGLQGEFVNSKHGAAYGIMGIVCFIIPVSAGLCSFITHTQPNHRVQCNFLEAYTVGERSFLHAVTLPGLARYNVYGSFPWHLVFFF